MLTPVTSSVLYCIHFNTHLDFFVLFLSRMTYRQEIITSKHTTELGLELTRFWSQMQDFKMPLKTKLVQLFLHLPLRVMETNMILYQKNSFGYILWETIYVEK